MSRAVKQGKVRENYCELVTKYCNPFSNLINESDHMLQKFGSYLQRISKVTADFLNLTQNKRLNICMYNLLGDSMIEKRL